MDWRNFSVVANVQKGLCAGAQRGLGSRTAGIAECLGDFPIFDQRPNAANEDTIRHKGYSQLLSCGTFVSKTLHLNKPYVLRD